MNRRTNIALAIALLTGMASALAQSPVVHANRGQSETRQARDEGNCHSYASKKTGFDPVVLAENSTPLQPGKGMTSVPSDGSSMMGGSAAGATGAGGGAMGASSAGMTSSGGGTGAMASPETGTGGSTGQGAMGASSGGMTSSGAGSQMGASSGGTASSGAGSQMGASSAGATGSSASQAQLAQQDSADLYNRTFARCMTSRGYMVESVSRGGTP
jgi:hypothetical protein